MGVMGRRLDACHLSIPDTSLSYIRLAARFGYSDLRDGRTWKMTMQATDSDQTPVLVVVDEVRQMDRRGWPVPNLTEARIATMTKRARAYCSEGVGHPAVRVDYIAFVRRAPDGDLCSAVCLRGVTCVSRRPILDRESGELLAPDMDVDDRTSPQGDVLPVLTEGILTEESVSAA